MQKFIPLLLFAAFLTGCGNYESKAKEDAQKAADQKATQGEFVKSPDLYYSLMLRTESLKLGETGLQGFDVKFALEREMVKLMLCLE